MLNMLIGVIIMEGLNPLVSLSPPWYTFANEVKYTYGMSRCVQVNNLVEVDGEYHLTINAYDDCIAEALRQVLPLTKDFGNIDVDITIFNSKGEVVPVINQVYTRETLAELYCRALTCNPFFRGVVLKPDVLPSTVGDVIVIIDKKVIQFYDDDISDLCANFNEVAAKVFKDVSNILFETDLTVNFSTYDERCLAQQNIYCC